MKCTVLGLATKAAVIFSTTGPAFAADEIYTDHPMWGGGFMGPLMMMFFFVIAVIVIVLLVRWLAPGSSSGQVSAKKSAVEILEERYAKGEIDKEEFEERKRVLDG